MVIMEHYVLLVLSGVLFFLFRSTLSVLAHYPYHLLWGSSVYDYCLPMSLEECHHQQ